MEKPATKMAVVKVQRQETERVMEAGHEETFEDIRKVWHWLKREKTRWSESEIGEVRAMAKA